MKFRVRLAALVGMISFLRLSAGTPSVTNRFEFREPRATVYEVVLPDVRLQGAGPASTPGWVEARQVGRPGPVVLFGSQVVLKLRPGVTLAGLGSHRPLTVAREPVPGVFLLRATNALDALVFAHELAPHPEVIASYPVTRRPKQLHGPYAAHPNDPYFGRQWNLENRAADGTPAGADLNVRAAWPLSRGEGVVIAVCDDGVDLNHPDLSGPAADMPHFNFDSLTRSGLHPTSFQEHGTAVAGLAVAQGENHRGMAGVASKARLLSLVIFGRNDNLVSEEALMDMFQYSSNLVSVQNHSWGNASESPLAPSLLEEIGISNAITLGRGGRGVIMVRSGGNGREPHSDANDDGYLADSRAIGVGAVRADGHVTTYSSPGACLLIAAPSGDDEVGAPSIFTTDRLGALGYNAAVTTNDLADYAFGSTGFSGTSASAPQISGLAALILAANPDLGYRDVQQILLLSARHVDLTDPDLVTNSVGFMVSHNAGFGVPDAGQAVALAKLWQNRPPLTRVTVARTDRVSIPDAGLRLRLEGTGVPPELASIVAVPGTQLHPDVPTAMVPLVDAGLALEPIALDLTHRAAVIQRGTNFFSAKIGFAAQAGAAFAVIYNNRDADQYVLMSGVDFAAVPAVFLNQNDGEALRGLLSTNKDVRGQLRLDSAEYTFAVNDALLCEHVLVTVDSDHPRRGDLRLTLVSPGGTRSVLQHANTDTGPGPAGWTYMTTHHFYEPSAGVWHLVVTDEQPGQTGALTGATLTILGVPIVDADGDGLDDRWERAHFGTLAYGPNDDPDGDGYSNAREQAMGTDPTRSDAPLAVNLSAWDNQRGRLSWPAQAGARYQILAASELVGRSQVVTNVPGRFPEAEWFAPLTDLASRFYTVRRLAP